MLREGKARARAVFAGGREGAEVGHLYGIKWGGYGGLSMSTTAPRARRRGEGRSVNMAGLHLDNIGGPGG